MTLNINHRYAASTYVGRNTTLADLLNRIGQIRDDLEMATDVPKSYPQGYVLDANRAGMLDDAIRELSELAGD